MSALAERLLALVVDVADFPTPGVVFKDVSPLLADPQGLAGAVEGLAAPWREAGVSHVVGVEARGFVLGAPVAVALGAGFVPVRKPGKLPGPTHSAEYELEYGSGELHVHRGALPPGARVLVVDDVLATGGTAAAAVALARRDGATVVGAAVLMELSFLAGRAALAAACPDVPLEALLVV